MWTEPIGTVIRGGTSDLKGNLKKPNHQHAFPDSDQ